MPVWIVPNDSWNCCRSLCWCAGIVNTLQTYERNSIKHNQETKDLVSGIKELLFPPQDDSAEGSTIPKEL
jgi:hypothetical protein